MYWEEDERTQELSVDETVVDIAYAIRCRALPVDHAYVLAEALAIHLPWLIDEAGVHSIHVADSGNGWVRPDHPDDLVYPSRRTRLVLRVPEARRAEALALAGTQLDIAGHALDIGEAVIRPLSTQTTLYARYVVDEGAADDEEQFLRRMAQSLREMGIGARKMMCGIGRQIRTPQANLRTRSLMLANLDRDEAIRLQQRGLGTARYLGCGLFIPHKDIQKVSARPQD